MLRNIMKKNVILIIGCFALSLALNSGCQNTSKLDQVGPPRSLHVTDVALATSIPHEPVEITASNFEHLVSNAETPVLVDFWAPWCGPCNAMSPTVDQVAEEYGGRLVVGKINIDEQQELAEKYNINAIPALVYFRDGQVVKQTSGMKTRQQLDSDIDSVISFGSKGRP